MPSDFAKAPKGLRHAQPSRRLRDSDPFGLGGRFGQTRSSSHRCASRATVSNRNDQSRSVRSGRCSRRDRASTGQRHPPRSTARRRSRPGPPPDGSWSRERTLIPNRLSPRGTLRVAPMRLIDTKPALRNSHSRTRTNTTTRQPPPENPPGKPLDTKRYSIWSGPGVAVTVDEAAPERAICVPPAPSCVGPVGRLLSRARGSAEVVLARLASRS